MARAPVASPPSQLRRQAEASPRTRPPRMPLTPRMSPYRAAMPMNASVSAELRHY